MNTLKKAWLARVAGTAANAVPNSGRTAPRGLMLLVTLAATVLTGCASINGARPILPDARQLAGSVPSAWIAPLPHGGNGAGLVNWWTRFNDPVLPRLVEAAQTVSASVTSATNRIAQARANATVAQAALLPTIRATADAARTRPDLITPLANIGNAGVGLSWELDVFGAAKAGRDASLSRLQSARAGWHEARVLVAAEVAQQYAAFRACEAQLGLAETDAASRSETDRLTQVLRQAGLQSPAVAALAQASAAQGRAVVTVRSTACARIVKGLVELTALDEASLRTLLAAGKARIPHAPPLPVDGVPAVSLAQRPDISRALSDVNAAAASLAQARAQRLPQISISGLFSRQRLESGPLVQTGPVWSVGPLQVTLPIFDGGRLRAGEDSARAALDEAKALLLARLRTAVREVEEALVVLDGAQRRSEDLRIAAEGYQAALAGTETRQRSGLASLFELEDARRSAVLADSARIDWQLEHVSAWITLYRALGGGWSATAAAPGQAKEP